MRLSDWVGYPVADRTVPSVLVERAMRECDTHRADGEHEQASAVSLVSGAWSVVTATEAGCHVFRLRSGTEATSPVAHAFRSWAGAREPELWLTGPSPLDLTVRVFAGDERVELVGRDAAARPLIEFARLWMTHTDVRVDGPIQGSGLLEFRGGPLADLTFRVESRTPLPAEIPGRTLGEPGGRYTLGSRVRSGGPFSMNWESVP